MKSLKLLPASYFCSIYGRFLNIFTFRNPCLNAFNLLFINLNSNKNPKELLFVLNKRILKRILKYERDYFAKPLFQTENILNLKATYEVF